MKKKFYYGGDAPYTAPQSSYTVTVNTTNCTASSYSETIDAGGTMSIIFTPSGTILSESDFEVKMTGSNLSKSYNSTTKKLTITCSNAASNIIITVTAKLSYNINVKYIKAGHSDTVVTYTSTHSDFSASLTAPAVLSQNQTYGISRYVIVTTNPMPTDDSMLLNRDTSPEDDKVYLGIYISLSNIATDITIQIYLTERYIRMHYVYSASICTLSGDVPNLVKYNTVYTTSIDVIDGYMLNSVTLTDDNDIIVKEITQSSWSVNSIDGYYSDLWMTIKCEQSLTYLNYHDYLFDVNCPRNAGTDYNFNYSPTSQFTYIQRSAMYFYGNGLKDTDITSYNQLNAYIPDIDSTNFGEWFIPVTYGKLLSQSDPGQYKSYVNPDELYSTSNVYEFELFNPIIYSNTYQPDISYIIVKHPIEHFLIPMYADNNNIGTNFIGYWATNRYTHSRFSEDSFSGATAYIQPYNQHTKGGFVEMILRPYFIYAPGYIRPINNFNGNVSAGSNYLRITNFGIANMVKDQDPIYAYGEFTNYSNLWNNSIPATKGFFVQTPDKNIGNYYIDGAKNIAGARLYNGDRQLIDVINSGIVTASYILSNNILINQTSTISSLNQANPMHLHIETDTYQDDMYDGFIYFTYLKEPDTDGIPTFALNEQEFGMSYMEDGRVLTTIIPENDSQYILPTYMESYCSRAEFPSYSTIQIYDISGESFVNSYITSMFGKSPSTRGGLSIKVQEAAITNNGYNGFGYSVMTDSKAFYPEGYGILVTPPHIQMLLQKASECPSLIAWPDVFNEYVDAKPSFVDNRVYTIKHFIYDRNKSKGSVWTHPYIIYPIPLMVIDEYLYDNNMFSEYFSNLFINYTNAYNNYGIKIEANILEMTSYTDIRLPYYHILPLDFIYSIFIEHMKTYGIDPESFIFSENDDVIYLLQQILNEQFNIVTCSYEDIMNFDGSEEFKHLYQLYIGIPIVETIVK